MKKLGNLGKLEIDKALIALTWFIQGIQDKVATLKKEMNITIL